MLVKRLFVRLEQLVILFCLRIAVRLHVEPLRDLALRRTVHLAANYDAFGLIFGASLRRSRLVFLIFKLVIVGKNIAHFLGRG